MGVKKMDIKQFLPFLSICFFLQTMSSPPSLVLTAPMSPTSPSSSTSEWSLAYQSPMRTTRPQDGSPPGAPARPRSLMLVDGDNNNNNGSDDAE